MPWLSLASGRGLRGLSGGPFKEPGFAPSGLRDAAYRGFHFLFALEGDKIPGLKSTAIPKQALPGRPVETE